jgi:protocatechuate 3,4-dioxygenase beta subunit
MERDPDKKTPKIRYLSRREVLGLMGSSAAAVVFVGCGAGEQSDQASSEETTSVSTGSDTASPYEVKPQQTERPYFVDAGLNRSDIREEREGVPLDLTFVVSRIDADAACTPLAGALVDIWQCDALGQYSGVENNEGETFLRGDQVTDESATAAIATMASTGAVETS